MGFAGRELGKQIEELLETEGYQEVKKYLEEYYGKEFIDSYEKAYGKEGVMELARKTAANMVCILKLQYLMVQQFEQILNHY